MIKRSSPTFYVYLIFLCTLVSGALAAKSPNIIFIFADDLGFGDLGCYGHPYAKTPALDKLAREGTRFTQAYAGGQTCNPSRTAIMTGMFPSRFAKGTGWNGFGDRVTVTELLNEAGYATGHFGKWHIGNRETERGRPSGAYGIDVNERCGPTDMYKMIVPEGRDAPIFDKTIEFIRQNKNRPFYVNVWAFSTHAPVFAHDKHLSKFKDLEVNKKDFSDWMQKKFKDCQTYDVDVNEAMRNYLADVYALDLSVKKLLSVIDELGLRKNTVIVFSSDQGPADIKMSDKVYNRVMPFKKDHQNMIGYAGEFRGGKHNLYEGGLRVPFIVRWPGKVKAGYVDKKSVCSGVDWLPSICSLAGVKAPKDIDGEDVSDMWLGAKRPHRKPLLWNGYPGASIREGKWRFYLSSKRSKGKEPDKLYDILKDPAEKNNLVLKEPQVASRLGEQVKAWLKELPKPIPDPKKKK